MILDAPPPDWKRPGTPPLYVQVKVLLRQLGFQGDFGEQKKVNWDHRPPLSERKFDTEKWDTVPAAQDPEFIEAIGDKVHDVRTNGPGGEKRITTLGSDTHSRTKTRHLREGEALHAARMDAKLDRIARRREAGAAFATAVLGIGSKATNPGRSRWGKQQKGWGKK